MIRIRELLDRNGEPVPIFLHGNPYGYRINVFHPDIKPHWMKWRIQCGEDGEHFPVSDECRLEFEKNLIEDWYVKLPPDRRPAELSAVYAEIFPLDDRSEEQPEESGQ